MKRCEACGAAIADGFEVEVDGKLYHTVHDPRGSSIALTGDELRQIQAQRSVKAAESRPVESNQGLAATMTAIVALIDLGAKLDPVDPAWRTLQSQMVEWRWRGKVTEGIPEST